MNNLSAEEIFALLVSIPAMVMSLVVRCLEARWGRKERHLIAELRKLPDSESWERSNTD